jgi:heme A synthase
MQSHGEILNYSKRGAAIRWPFRLLAMVIVVAVLLAALGSAYVASEHRDPRAALLALTAAPVAALVGRLGGYAVWTGRVIRNPYWPFASGSLVAVWFLIAWIIGSYA